MFVVFVVVGVYVPEITVVNETVSAAVKVGTCELADQDRAASAVNVASIG
jgi:hypothetical protein